MSQHDELGPFFVRDIARHVGLPDDANMDLIAETVRASHARADALQQEIATLRKKSALDEAQCDEMTDMAGRLAEEVTTLRSERDKLREGLCRATSQAQNSNDRRNKAEAEREAHAAQLHRLTEALQRIVNASYTELRPIVEHYSHDPTASPVLYPDAKVIRSHATEAEWALVRQVAKYFQDIGIAALASVDQGTETA